jgi:glycolate oxidase iron-sulfur subunit
MEDIAATGAGTVVSANPGCLMQLEWGRKRAGTSVEARHIVQLLDESLDR